MSCGSSSVSVDAITSFVNCLVFLPRTPSSVRYALCFAVAHVMNDAHRLFVIEAYPGSSGFIVSHKGFD